MSDKRNNKERDFKDILQNAEFEPNMEGLWDRVEAELEDEPRRKPFILWWGGIGLVLIAFLALGYLISGEKGSLEVTPDIIIADVKSSQIKTELESNAAVLEENEKLSNANSKSTIKSETEINFYSEVSESQASEQGEKTYLTKVENNRKVSKEVENGKSNIINFNDNNKLNQESEENTQSMIPFLQIHQNVEETIDGSQAKIDKELPQYAISSSQEKSETISYIDKLPSLISELIYENRKGDVGQDINLYKVQESKYFVTLRGGILQGYSSVSDVKPVDNFDVAAFDREEDLPGYDIGLDIGRYIGMWRVYAGGSIREVITRYTRVGTDQSEVTEDGTAYVYIDENGNSESLDGDVSVVTKTTYNTQWHRGHRMVDLHVGAGTNLLSFGRLSLGMDAELGYNVYASHRGYQLVEGTEVLQILATGDKNNYRNNTGMSAAIRGKVAFNIQAMDISLVPVWRYQFSPLTNNNHIYKIKNSQLGLQLAITYKPRWK